MNPNEQHRQRMQQTITAHQQKQQMKEFEEVFYQAVKQYKDIIGKTVLVGLQGMGISTSVITAVAGELVGALAVCLSTDETAGEEGQWYDVRQITLYKVYGDVEAAVIKQKFKDGQPQAAVPLGVIPPPQT